jgi:hypothetical protein
MGFFLIRESYAPVLRARKAAQLRNESGKIQTQKGAPAPKNIGILILRPLKLLMFSPVVLLLSFSMSITYSYIYLLFTTLPAVFMDVYGVSQSTAGYLFTGLGIGMFVGLIICLLTFPKIMARKKKSQGKILLGIPDVSHDTWNFYHSDFTVLVWVVNTLSCSLHYSDNCNWVLRIRLYIYLCKPSLSFTMLNINEGIDPYTNLLS